jgi:hypothetical protein
MFVWSCLLFQFICSQNVTWSADSIQAKEEQIRQDAFQAGVRSAQAATTAKKEAAAILSSQLPAQKGDQILTRDPLVPIGTDQAAVPVAQMRSADDAIFEAFSSFLQPKIFNQNQVKANQPTPPPTTVAPPPVFVPQTAQDPNQLQQRFLPFGGQDVYQNPSYGIPQQAAAPYQALDPRMMGIPNAGIPNQFGAQPQIGGWPQQF